MMDHVVLADEVRRATEVVSVKVGKETFSANQAGLVVGLVLVESDLVVAEVEMEEAVTVVVQKAGDKDLEAVAGDKGQEEGAVIKEGMAVDLSAGTMEEAVQVVQEDTAGDYYV